ncbi:MAG: O-methyltransferase [Rickettsiales bacterium]|nr:O-methyltransferase [Rickettsiales bacterium]
MPREHITPNIDYIRKLYAPQDSLLASIEDMLKKLDIAWQVGPEEGRLLQLLIRLCGARRIVEIGTLAGYSTIWMARALPEGGQIFTIGKDPEHNQMAKHFFDQSDVADRITLLEGDAHVILPVLSKQAPYDMIFIDADKISYPDYLDWAEENIRAGGLIVADNTLLFDSVALDSAPPNIAPKTWQAMRSFNERLADKNKFMGVMIPTAEGMSVAIKLL